MKMVYSAGVSEATLAKCPHLVSKVRHNKDYGYYDFKKSAVAYEGKYRVYAPASEYFGGDDSYAYVSDVLTNPTWGTLYKHAERSMKNTKDEHHIFFEGVYKGETSPDGVTTLHLLLGS